MPPSHLSGLGSFTQNSLPPGPNQPPPQNLTMPPNAQNLPASAGYVAPPSHLQPPIADPLQSLKEVKVYFFINETFMKGQVVKTFFILLQL